MMMPALLRLSLIALALLFALGGSARAEDPPLGKPKDKAALEHLTRGNNLYKVRSFDQAATEYKAGAVIEPAPIFDYNLGQCYRQLGKYEDAIWHYQQFVKTSPNTTEHNQAVQDFIKQMKAELDKKAMSAQPTDAAPSTSEAPLAASQPPVEQSDQAPRLTDRHADHWYADGLGWGLAGAGVIGVVVSGGLFLDASSLQDDANNAASQQEQNSLHDKADTRSLLGTVIGIGGLGLLATGIVKLAIHDDSSQEPTTAAWGIGVSSNGVRVFGRF
jgi:tetratricopeptide (TPR) repeat protein